jgi:hypothetical protein
MDSGIGSVPSCLEDATVPPSQTHREKLLPSASAVLPEPVSPELVLVDPELARRERARLEERAYLEEVLNLAALRRAVQVEPPPEEETGRQTTLWREAATLSRRRLLPVALMCSLLANGFFVARLVTHSGEEAAHVAVRMVTLTSTQQNHVAPAFPAVGSKVQPAIPRSPLRTRGAVEREVVSLILAAPSRKLPRDFVDPTTGLVKNNVQVVCTKKSTRSFLCAIRLASESAHEPLYVRYHTRKNGKAIFTWYGRSTKISS